jgi:hydrogenase-4 component E
MPSLTSLMEVVLLLNFFVLGATRLRTAIYLVATQGVVLGVAPLWIELDARVALLAMVTVAVKGIVIPRLLFFALRDVAIGPEFRPTGGFIASLLLGAIGTGLAIWFSHTLPLRDSETQLVSRLIVPASLATIFTGFVMLTTRSRTIGQVMGYLVLENGVFLFGLLLLEAVPLLVEAGVLLDLLVAVFVMGIIMRHINRALDPLAERHLSALRE